MKYSYMTAHPAKKGDRQKSVDFLQFSIKRSFLVKNLLKKLAFKSISTKPLELEYLLYYVAQSYNTVARHLCFVIGMCYCSLWYTSIRCMLRVVV